VLSAPESGNVIAGCLGKVFWVIGCVVGQGVAFEVAPNHLDRVDLRGIGWQKETMKSGGSGKYAIDDFGAMGEGSVPDYEQGLLHLAAELPQKAGHAHGSDVLACMERKIKSYPLASWRNREGRDGRDLAVSPSDLAQNWRSAAGCPGASDQRRQEKAALVDERNVGVQASGFFLMCGQSTLIQCRMAFSSRSRARRSGFCGVQPIERRSRGR